MPDPSPPLAPAHVPSPEAHDLTEQAAELAALLAVSRALSSTLELEPLLDVILDQIKLIIPYDGAAITTHEGNVIRMIRRRAPTVLDLDQHPLQGVRRAPDWDALNQRSPVLIDDVRGESPEARYYRDQQAGPLESSHLSYIRSWMAVPLIASDRVIGRIVVAHGQPAFYTERQVTLLTAIAAQVAAAINNARLFERERTTARELATILDMSRIVASTLELKPLIALILDQLKQIIDYAGAGVSLIDGGDLVQIDVRRPNPRAQAAGRDIRMPIDRYGLIQSLLARGQPVIIDDVRGPGELAGAYRHVVGNRLNRALAYITAWMAVPLLYKDRVIGLLSVASSEPAAFNQRHVELAQVFANHAAVAITNARLLAETEQRTHELATLLEVSRAVVSTLDQGDLLHLILEQLKSVLAYRGATIGLIDGDDILIVASRAVDPERERDRGLRFPLWRFGPIWSALITGRSFIIPDVRGDTPAAVEYRTLNGIRMDQPTHREIRSWMAAPLAVGDRVIGMLTASQDVPDYFTEHHADLALAFANQAAVAIENARLFGEVRDKASLEERQRLARELHDSVSQALFGIALGAGAARRRLEVDPARVGESLDYVLSLADAALTEMRALIFELRPEMLEKDGLAIALTRHAASVRARHEISVEATFSDEPDVPLAVKEAFYRVAQEAMHNTVKHARATRIDLSLTNDASGLTLVVEDNGAGFDPAGQFAGHLGLHSMRERLAALAGSVMITSTPGDGTRIVAHLPSLSSS